MRRLNVDCIANILSLTSPEETCRLSLVSTAFHSASESDDVWEKFLPLDYKDIISRSSLPPPPFSSKKQLYMWLSDNHVIIDHGTKSFSVEKRSGKSCYMLGSKDLSIAWGDAPQYWRWTSLPDSRFAKVAELLSVCWLEIRGKINTNLLSPNTTYTAFLMYKLSEHTYGFGHNRIEVYVGLKGETPTTHKVCLELVAPLWNADDDEEQQDGGYEHTPEFEEEHHLLVEPIGIAEDDEEEQEGEYENEHVYEVEHHLLVAPIGNAEDDEEQEGEYEHEQEYEEVEVEVEVEEEDEEDEQEDEDKEIFYPKMRGDGWMELPLGNYLNYSDNYNSDGLEEVGIMELEMSLMEGFGADWKSGLIVQGIEIRPN